MRVVGRARFTITAESSSAYASYVKKIQGACSCLNWLIGHIVGSYNIRQDLITK